MYKKGQHLLTDADLDNAMLFGINIEVWQQNDVLDYGGQIESHNDNVVTINGAHYFKSSCVFLVR